jgi:hypothetical protein
MKAMQKNIQVDEGTHAEIAELALEGQRSIADQVRFLLREYKRQQNVTVPCSQYTPVSDRSQGASR